LSGEKLEAKEMKAERQQDIINNVKAKYMECFQWR
jgi:hypothetical protein